MESLYDRVQKSAISSDNELEALERLREKLGEHADFPVGQWVTLYDVGGIVDRVMALPEYTIDGYGVRKCTRNHFLMEMFRTPRVNPPTLYNVLKIAFYGGLVRANLKASDYPDGIVKLFKDFKLHALVNYIEKGRSIPDIQFDRQSYH